MTCRTWIEGFLVIISAVVVWHDPLAQLCCIEWFGFGLFFCLDLVGHEDAARETEAKP